MIRTQISLTINGKMLHIDGKYVFLPISDYLRYFKGLTGTKIVCSEGDCGACTVMYLRSGSKDQKFLSLNTCIVPAMLLDGCHLITVEALKDEESLSEIQDAMIRNFGAQCGFCTPGFIMSLANMFEQDKKIDEQKVKNYLTGNLCRCTGYYSIIEAALDVDTQKVSPLINKYDFNPLDNKLKEFTKSSVLISWNKKEFFAPNSLEEASKYKAKNPNTRIFAGATDIGVQSNKGKDAGQYLMSLHLVQDLYELKQVNDSIHVGARVTLSQLQYFIEDKAPEFANFLNIFASPQIKNTATLIGNVANGSPIADTTPYLLTADAEVNLVSVSGARTVALVDFILGYKNFDIKEDELITGVNFKILDKNTKVGLYKVSQRRDLDISCINSSFAFQMDKKIIKKARIALGGVAEKTIRLTEVEKSISNKELNDPLVKDIQNQIKNSIKPISDARGTWQFRKELSSDLFKKFIQEHM